MKFEWDVKKNELNIAKHNISFEIAESVFDDKNAVYLYDETHSLGKNDLHFGRCKGMKAEYSLKDFKGVMLNPFYDKLNKEVVVSVRREVYQVFADIAEQNGEEPEKVMRRCLTDYAKRLLEHE